MKKKFNGYTLAEVLITLAIVGVIAALVVPRLVNNTNNATISSSLARGVELTQNGMANIMMEAQNRSDEEIAPANLASIELRDILGGEDEDYITDGANLFASTMSFMGTEEVNNYNIDSIRNYAGGVLGNGMLTNTHAYKFKKANPVIIFQEVPAAGIADKDNDDIITRIFIDANGSSGPNRTGRDVFLFGLTNSGHMVPAGSAAYEEFDDNVTAGACDNQPGDGLACAARVMADKWNINY